MEEIKTKYFKDGKLTTIPKKEKNKLPVLQLVLENNLDKYPLLLHLIPFQ